MQAFYAVCPHCGKTVYVEENLSGDTVCTACAETLDLAQLRDGGFIIDVTASEEEYNLAQQYFNNTDFLAAGEHFKKVLTYNRNHYLADYYASLCGIYENEDKPEYNVPKYMVEALISSIAKMGMCQTAIKYKVDFLISVLNQAHIILSSYFNRVCERYEKTEKWDILREKCMDLCLAVKELANLDKENLMIFDLSIQKSLVSIADLGVCACRKVVVPHQLQELTLDLPTDIQYERAKSCYGLLTYYATSLDPGYDVKGYKPDFTANLVFSESVITKLNAYNTVNKSANKKYLSTPGEELEAFKKYAEVAIKYSYQTCLKCFFTDNEEKARLALITDSILFAFELIMPRVYLDKEKRYKIDVKNLEKMREISVYLSDFLNDVGAYNQRIASELVTKFYFRLFETIKAHYSTVYSNYNRQLDKLKELKNDEFMYYQDFLHTVIYSCLPALSDIVPYFQANMSEKLKILKLGKQVTEEFLFLNNYNVQELEKSPKYSDVIDIFNEFDDELEELTGKRK